MGTLTLTQMQTLVQQIAGDDSGVQFPNAMVLSFLNQSLLDVTRRTQAYVKQYSTTTLTVVGDFNALTPPADFLQVSRLRWNNQPLYVIPATQVKRQILAAGVPFSYFMWGQYIRFYPESTATTGLDIDLDYVAAPTLLAAAGDVTVIPPQYDMDVVQGAVMLCKQREEDTEGFQLVGAYQGERLAQSLVERQSADYDSYPGIQDVDPLYQTSPWVY